jgi:uncharacterized protein YjbI with pentapeptide repeats
MDRDEFWRLYAEGERYFSGVNLSGADLSRAVLNEAFLRGADLSSPLLSE